MNLAVAQESRIFQTRDQAEDARLLGESQMILKADDVVGIGAQIFLSKLHNSIRATSGAGIDEADRLHGPKAQRVAPAASDLLDGQATLKVIQLLPVAVLNRFGGEQRVEEAVVLLAIHRAIN